jgi:methyltransferase (TIGR00027 family)
MVAPNRGNTPKLTFKDAVNWTYEKTFGMPVSILSLAIYIPLQIAFIPFAILGFVLVAYRQIQVSKKLGISQTAIEVLNGRWTMHVFGLRNDEACAKLARALPNTSVMGLWLALFPLWLKFKISGKPFLYPRVPEAGTETIADLMVARTPYFDRVIERVIGEVEQFVVMGAGYDTRAYGGLARDTVTFFELDQPQVQQHKRNALNDAKIPCEHVHFVAVDFSKESPFDRLVEAGYDPAKKTLFLWEGVSLYLSEPDVRKTMQDVRNHAPSGSVLLADIYADRFLNISKSSAVQKTLDYTDEGLGFGLPFAINYEETLAGFVEAESMSVGETFFMGYGSDKGPFMVVVEMRW